ncbi:23S rRNA (adenine(1618)-N(6))-methyltransferase RlmF [Hymenobacter psychrophilus]|uniref:Ribosomal RNA large subunit methyltransferase F n=1 Tax=Hymenobacter psychrophilus TaxID=651662 RepID=A0A1H3D935_9BACT|nr:23S rRNA (adenine(1618)-N(6))-methyltransferase RlmF [Hymenobacter psychrophilus]SDX62658.1 23S rRNA m(6)A-1618 methyltransferase [Hymenobacter psychrophilus]
MHPRNPHNGRYDFAQLTAASPALAPFVVSNPAGDNSIDFANPAAVKALNQALLRQHYDVQHWDVPAGYLCPPIPGRADYLHYAADLLATDNAGTVPTDKAVHVLDIGVGANCVYPIIGSKAYGWRFVGSETDSVALKAAKSMVAVNPALTNRVELRAQSHLAFVFEDIVKPKEEFDLVVCNPPFHSSAEEAASGSRRKGRNLGYPKTSGAPVLNFGGQNTELWCEGGEEGFLKRMVAQSVGVRERVLWFSTLISKKETLPSIYHFLKLAGSPETRTIEMKQGQKISRIVAWTFQTPEQRQEWAARRWKVKVDS